MDSTLAEEREDQRRREWQKQGADDEADVRRSLEVAITRVTHGFPLDRAQISAATVSGTVQPVHLPPIIG